MAAIDYTKDPTTINLCTNTANKFSELCALRGITARVEWRAEEMSYYCNGERCGPSIDGCYDWLNKQPGVKP